MIKLGQLKRSFKNAWRGIVVVFRSEQSFRIQVFVGLFVLVLAYGFKVRSVEFILLLLLVAAVLSLELINSVFERMADLFKPRLHPVVRDIKDIMAGTVLLVSVLSAVIGIIIFWPHLETLF